MAPRRSHRTPVVYARPDLIEGSITTDIAAIEVSRMLTRQPEAHFHRTPTTGEYTSFLREMSVSPGDERAMSALNRAVGNILHRGQE
jgi:hypothetical protein